MKRYCLYTEHGQPIGQEWADGDWCRWQDVEAVELAAKNYRNVLVGMEFEELDMLAAETRDTTQIGYVATKRIAGKDERIAKMKMALMSIADYYDQDTYTEKHPVYDITKSALEI